MKDPKKIKAHKKLGKKIREFRKAQKISQKQLAFESDLSRQYIVYLEAGQQSPTIDSLLSISEVLNVQVKELLDF